MTPEEENELREIKKLADEETKKVKETSDELVEKYIKSLIDLGKKIAGLKSEIVRATTGGAVGFFAGFWAGAKLGTVGGIAFGPVGAAVGAVVGAGGTVLVFRPARRKKLEEQLEQLTLEEDIALKNLKSSFRTSDEILAKIAALPVDAPQVVKDKLWDLYKQAVEDAVLERPTNEQDIPRRRLREVTVPNTSAPSSQLSDIETQLRTLEQKIDEKLNIRPGSNP